MNIWIEYWEKSNKLSKNTHAQIREQASWVPPDPEKVRKRFCQSREDANKFAPSKFTFAKFAFSKLALLQLAPCKLDAYKFELLKLEKMKFPTERLELFSCDFSRFAKERLTPDISAFAKPTPFKSKFSTKLQFVQSTSFAGGSSHPAFTFEE